MIERPLPRVITFLLAGLIATLLATSNGCRRPRHSVDPAVPAPSTTPPPTAPATFRGETALDHARQLAGLGARTHGSPARAAARAYCAARWREAGWTVVEQSFDALTPDGNRTFVNLVARFPAKGTEQAVVEQDLLLGAHYDSCQVAGLAPGANDGASGPAVLLELARSLAAAPQLASRVEMVLFDGREPVRQFAADDGLYGSRFHASQLPARPTPLRLAIVLGMVGAHGGVYTLTPDTPAPLAAAVRTALGEQADSFAVAALRPVWDDHLPFAHAGVPVLLLTDIDYPYVRTADDTVARLDPDTLRRTASVVLALLTAPPLAPP